MNDARSILERESLRHHLPSGSFDRLTRKRDRRRRNQRITAGVVAFAVVAAAFTGALELLHQSRVAPAAQAITPQNVGRLKLQWSASLDGEAARLSNRPYGDAPFSPIAAGDLVLTATKAGTLYAFPTACSDACRPAWTARIEGGMSYPPTVADGVAYTVSATGHVAAFGLNCAIDGSICQPLWTGNAGHGINSSPVLSGGMLLGIDATSSLVYAFSTACGTNGGVCAPAWSTYVGPLLKTVSVTPGLQCANYKGAVIAPAASDGVVFAPDAADFSLHALDAATGRPLWVARPQIVSTQPLIVSCPKPGPSGWVDAPVVDGGTVYWAAGASVYGYSESCRRDGGTCRPTWRSMGGANGQPVVTNGVVYVADAYRARIEAYANPCGNGRAVCKPLWHAQLFTTFPGASYAVLSTSPGRIFASYPLDVFSLPPRTRWSQVRLVEFAASCEPRGKVCEPEWISPAIPESSLAPVIAVDGVVYTGTTSGQVYAFREACNACGPAWDYADPISRKLSTPAIVGGRIYVAAGDGRLLAFGLPPLPVLAPPTVSKRGAAIFYLAVALVGAAFLAVSMERKRRRRSSSAT